MDRIRRALDLARLERERMAAAAEPPAAQATTAAATVETVAAGAPVKVETEVGAAPFKTETAPRVDVLVAATVTADTQQRAQASTVPVAPIAVGMPSDRRVPSADPVPNIVEATAATPGPASDAGRSSAIVYTRTRVFTPLADVLERNRIFDAASSQPAAVAFRMLRTQVVQRMDAHGWRSLAIFSPGASDGKTTTAINLAISLAGDRLHTVLLVDLDFKHPTMAARLGLAPQFGSDDALLGNAPVEDCLYHPEGFDRLVIMPARATLDNSSEMLAGPRGRALVGELRLRYPERILLFDLPPVLTADDALSFAPLVECGLVVAAEGRTRRNDLSRTVELLAKTPLLGTALNRAGDVPSGH